MEEDTIQIEILLMIGTSFASRVHEGDELSDCHKLFSEKERLEEACWNGLLNKMLPEMCSPEDNINSLYIWNIREGSTFLELELGKLPAEIDNYFSINPYFFAELKSLN